MKRVLFILLMVLPLLGYCGNIEVKSFTAQLFDISASKYERLDLNGNPCALVKVRLPIEGCKFEGNVIDWKFDVNEYWVWLTKGTKRFDIKCPDSETLSVFFGKVSDIESLESGMTYDLRLSGYSQAGQSAASDPGMTAASSTLRTEARNLDLCAMRDGKPYFFSEEEWNEMPVSEQAKFNKKGVAIFDPFMKDRPFVLSLNCSEPITWDEAVKKYGEDRLPTERQTFVMFAQNDAINKAIESYGGTVPPTVNQYWGEESRDPSRAWVVDMVRHDTLTPLKSKTYRVRTVAPVTLSSAISTL